MSQRSVLIIGHGSRDPVAVQEFLDFAQEFHTQNGFDHFKDTQVACAFLELSEPSIPNALEQLAKKGINQIVAIPYLLFRAGHVKEEIPHLLAEFRRNYPGIKVEYGNCLWPHPNLITLAKKRICESLNLFPEKIRKEVDVLVVGRGATDPEAIAQFEDAIKKLRAVIPCRQLQHCFIALAEPKYVQALPEMLQNGIQNLLIFPFYLFTGILVKRIEAQAQEAKNKFSRATIKIAPYFGSDPMMFEMLRNRIEEVIPNT